MWETVGDTRKLIRQNGMILVYDDFTNYVSLYVSLFMRSIYLYFFTCKLLLLICWEGIIVLRESGILDHICPTVYIDLAKSQLEERKEFWWQEFDKRHHPFSVKKASERVC